MFALVIRIVPTVVFEFLRLVSDGMLVWFAAPVHWFFQRRRLATLRRDAKQSGFERTGFDVGRQLAILTGTFSGVEVEVMVLDAKKSRDSGVFVTADLEAEPRFAHFDASWLMHVIRTLAKASQTGDQPQLRTGHVGFDFAFAARYADEETAERIAADKELLEATARLRRRWFWSTRALTISSWMGGPLRLQLRLGDGGELFPYIGPQKAREAAADVGEVAARWNAALARRARADAGGGPQARVDPEPR